MDEDNFICQKPKPAPSKNFWKGILWGTALSIPLWMIIFISLHVLTLEGK